MKTDDETAFLYVDKYEDGSKSLHLGNGRGDWVLVTVGAEVYKEMRKAINSDASRAKVVSRKLYEGKEEG